MTAAEGARGRGWFSPLNPPLRDWSGKRVWLIGASSGIGLALAIDLRALGASVAVSARDAGALQQFAASHPGVDRQGRPLAQAVPLDATDLQSVEAAAAAVFSEGPLDLAIYGAGMFKPMRATEFDLDVLLRHVDVNVAGALRVFSVVIPQLLKQRHGHLSMIASVAGSRGLPKGLAYGPTKAALINLAETMYLDLRPHGIGVSLINPGFVDTPMTKQNDFPMPAMIEPERAAQEILEGWASGAFEIHFPKRFTRLVKLARLLPNRLYFSAVNRATGL
ncbi:MAG: SDR family NAD(P)-dependent oxidoreductase [Burkholderiales bacterium]